MGSFKIIEDRPTPKAVYNVRIYAFAIIVCESSSDLLLLFPMGVLTPPSAAFGAILFGFDGSFWGTTYARKSFQEDFGITKMSKSAQTNASSNLTSVYLAGAFFGSLFAWPVMEYSGRRMILRISSVIFLVGALLMTVTNNQLSMMCGVAGSIHESRLPLTSRASRCWKGDHWFRQWRADCCHSHLCRRIEPTAHQRAAHGVSLRANSQHY